MATPQQQQQYQHSALSLSSIAPVVASSSTESSNTIHGSRKSSISTISNVRSSTSGNVQQNRTVQGNGSSTVVARPTATEMDAFPSSSAFVRFTSLAAAEPRHRRVSFVQHAPSEVPHTTPTRSPPTYSRVTYMTSTAGSLHGNKEPLEKDLPSKVAPSRSSGSSPIAFGKRTPSSESYRKHPPLHMHRSPSSLLDTSNESPGYNSATPVKKKRFSSSTEKTGALKASPSSPARNSERFRISDYDKVSNLIGANWLDQELQRLVAERKKREELDAFIKEEDDHLVSDSQWTGKQKDKRGTATGKTKRHRYVSRTIGDRHTSRSTRLGGNAILFPPSESLSTSSSCFSSSSSSRSTTPSRSSFSNHLREIHTDLRSIGRKRNRNSKHTDANWEGVSPHDLLHVTGHVDDDPAALHGTTALETLEADKVLTGLLDIKDRMEKVRSRSGATERTGKFKRCDATALDTDADAAFFSPEAYVTALFEDDEHGESGNRGDRTTQTDRENRRERWQEKDIVVGEENTGKVFKRLGKRTLFEGRDEADEARALLRYSVESGDTRVLEAMRSTLLADRHRLARDMATRASTKERAEEEAQPSAKRASAENKVDKRSTTGSKAPVTVPPAPTTATTLHEPSVAAFPSVSPQLEEELGRQRRLLETMLRTQQNYLRKLTAETAGNERLERNANYDSEERIRFGPYFATATPDFHDAVPSPAVVPRQRVPPPFTISTATRGVAPSAQRDSGEADGASFRAAAHHTYVNPTPAQIQQLQQKYAGLLLAEEQKRLYAETQWQRALHDLNDKFSTQQQHVLREITNAAKRQQESFQKDFRLAVSQQQQEQRRIIAQSRTAISPSRGVEVVMSDQEHAPITATRRSSPGKASPVERKAVTPSPSKSPYLHRSPVKHTAHGKAMKRTTPVRKHGNEPPRASGDGGGGGGDSPVADPQHEEEYGHAGHVQQQQQQQQQPHIKALLSPNHPLRRKQARHLRRRRTPSVAQRRRSSQGAASRGTRASFSSPFPSASSPPARNVFTRVSAQTLTDGSQSTRSETAMDTSELAQKETAVYNTSDETTKVEGHVAEVLLSAEMPDTHAETKKTSRRSSSTASVLRKKASGRTQSDVSEPVFAVSTGVVHELEATDAFDSDENEEDEVRDAPKKVQLTMHPVAKRRWTSVQRTQSLSVSSAGSASAHTPASVQETGGAPSGSYGPFRDLGAARLSESSKHEVELSRLEQLPLSSVTEQQHFVDRALEEQRRRQQSAQHVLPPMVLVSDVLTPMERAKKQEADAAYNPTEDAAGLATPQDPVVQEEECEVRSTGTGDQSSVAPNNEHVGDRVGGRDRENTLQSKSATSSAHETESLVSFKWLAPPRKHARQEKYVERVPSRASGARNFETTQTIGQHFLRPTFGYNAFGAAALEHPTSQMYVVTTSVHAPRSTVVWLGNGGLSQLAPMQQMTMEANNAYNNHLHQHHIPFGRSETAGNTSKNAMKKTPFLVRTDYSFSSSTTADDQNAIPAAVAQPWLYDRSLRREAAELLRDARRRLHRIQELSLPSPAPFPLRRASTQGARIDAQAVAEEERQRLTTLIANETIHCVLGDAVEQGMLDAVSCSIEQDLIAQLVCEKLLDAENEKAIRTQSSGVGTSRMTEGERSRVSEELLLSKFEELVRTWAATQSAGTKRVTTTPVPVREESREAKPGMVIGETAPARAVSLPWVHETVGIPRGVSDAVLEDENVVSKPSSAQEATPVDHSVSLPAHSDNSSSPQLAHASRSGSLVSGGAALTSTYSLFPPTAPGQESKENAMEVVVDPNDAARGGSSDVRIVLDVSMLMQAIAGLTLDRQRVCENDTVDLRSRQQRCQLEEERVRTMDVDLSHCIVEQQVVQPSPTVLVPTSFQSVAAESIPTPASSLPRPPQSTSDSTDSANGPPTPLHMSVTEIGSPPRSPSEMHTPTAVSVAMSPSPSLPTPPQQPPVSSEVPVFTPFAPPSSAAALPQVPDSLAQLRDEISAVAREQRLQHVMEMERIRRRSIQDSEDDIRHVLHALMTSSHPPPLLRPNKAQQGETLQSAVQNAVSGASHLAGKAPAARASGVSADALQRVKDPVTRFIFEWLRDYEQREASGGETLQSAQFDELRAQLRAAEDTAFEPERATRERAAHRVISGRIHDALEEEMEEELDQDAREAATLLRVLAEIDQESDSASSLSSTHASSYTDGGNHKFVDDLVPPLPLPQLHTHHTDTLYQRKIHAAESEKRNRRRLDRNLFGGNENSELEDGAEEATRRHDISAPSRYRITQRADESSSSSTDREEIAQQTSTMGRGGSQEKPTPTSIPASTNVSQPLYTAESPVIAPPPLSTRHDAASIASEAIASGMRAGQHRLSSTSSGSTATTRYTDMSDNTPDVSSSRYMYK